jgi:uncharacterized membrane-anchored protein
MTIASADHPFRARLVAETHARPTLPLLPPCVVTDEIFLHSDGGKEACAALSALCAREGASLPAPDSDVHTITLGAVTLKWERHGEFNSWTTITPGSIMPPALYSTAAPGQRLAATRMRLVEGPVRFEPVAGNEHAGARLSGGLARVWTDLSVAADGFVDILVETVPIDGGNAARLGRLARRLREIESYRMLALLALPEARALLRELDRLDRQVTTAFTMTDRTDREVLASVMQAAQEAESLLMRHDFRFAAAAAYRGLVEARLKELREERIEGEQRLSTFILRRFDPAMVTVATTRARLERLNARIERASTLLRTRVDLQLQEQSQALLRSMNDRARLQLRLQQTVEGLSVVAISYYAFMLAQKLLHGLAGPWLDARHVPTGLADALLVLLIVLAVALLLRLARRRLKG